MFGKLCWALALSATVVGAAASDARGQSSVFERAKSYLGSGGGASSPSSTLSLGEIASGLKEALKVGTDRVVGRLGRTDGFNTDADVHIPLPDTMRRVQSALSAIGMSEMADDLELRLNRAAEAATPEAKELFWNAIADMTLDDARAIYEGPSDSATRYFQGKMSDPLAARMVPIVDAALADAGAIQAYDRMMGQYRTLPFMPDVKADLTAYVIDKGLDGIFHYLAKEEAAIRQNPAMRTTELLQRVFGS